VSYVRSMGSRPSRPPWWAVVGSAAFVAIVPGTVVGWVPYLLTGWAAEPPFGGLVATRWLGGVLVVVGALVFVDFVSRFVWEGHGTPAPVAPTRHLVVNGPFRWCRNPGYVAVLAMLVGQGFLLGSAQLLLYAAAVAVAFHVFVLYYEEPTLRRTFGAEFEAYCRQVPRWVPRLPHRPERGPSR
jgi:protein-S-isoprenylcysteine O-methyltransferase Ste14